MKYPSVTTVLSPFSDFSKVPSGVLENAAARGTRVHRWCSAHALKLMPPRLQEEDKGYCRSFKNWFDKYVVKVILVEKELIDKNMGFMGHPDLIVIIKGDRAQSLGDLKTPLVKHPLWRGQIAAYRHLAIVNGYPVKRGFTLRLDREGKAPRVDEYIENPRDMLAFQAALSAWNHYIGGK